MNMSATGEVQSLLTDSRTAHFRITFMHFMRCIFYVMHIQDYSFALVILVKH